MHDSSGQPGEDSGTLQLILDQLEELVVTLIEEIRERPAVAAAILAAVVGALVGMMLAGRLGRSHASAPKKVVRQARGMAQASDLAGLAVRLLQNPIVRGYVASAVQSQFKRRFSM